MKAVVNATPLISLALLDRLLLARDIRIAPRWQQWFRTELRRESAENRA